MQVHPRNEIIKERTCRVCHLVASRREETTNILETFSDAFSIAPRIAKHDFMSTPQIRVCDYLGRITFRFESRLVSERARTRAQRRDDFEQREHV